MASISRRQALLIYRATALGEERLTARRRSRTRPLTDYASRSPLHAFGVWMLRSALIALIGLAAWLLVADWAVPTLTEGFRP